MSHAVVSIFDGVISMTNEQIKQMVDRFLSWKLPADFNPDGGVSFKNVFAQHWPVGTNLLTAVQAEEMVRHMIGDMPAARMHLVKSTCEVRDSRWSIHIDAADEPCSVRVTHRQYGDYYDWPEATFEGPGGVYGGVCPAADRAYTMQDESNFRTRSAAMKAAHDFLRRFGAGDVEYLEWDVDSQSMLVVGHAERRSMWWKHPDDTPDPLAPFYAEKAA
jgi:hypothetical protein